MLGVLTAEQLVLRSNTARKAAKLIDFANPKLDTIPIRRCDKAIPMFMQGMMMSSQGEGLADNLSGTIEDGKQSVMVSIFYVGYSHCADDLQAMLDYVKKALEVNNQGG